MYSLVPKCVGRDVLATAPCHQNEFCATRGWFVEQNSTFMVFIRSKRCKAVTARLRQAAGRPVARQQEQRRAGRAAGTMFATLACTVLATVTWECDSPVDFACIHEVYHLTVQSLQENRGHLSTTSVYPMGESAGWAGKPPSPSQHIHPRTQLKGAIRSNEYFKQTSHESKILRCPQWHHSKHLPSSCPSLGPDCDRRPSGMPTTSSTSPAQRGRQMMSTIASRRHDVYFAISNESHPQRTTTIIEVPIAVIVTKTSILEGRRPPRNANRATRCQSCGVRGEGSLDFRYPRADVDRQIRQIAPSNSKRG